MSSDVQREIGEHLASELPNLDYGPGPFPCGCWPEDCDTHDGVTWCYRRDIGFHDPNVPHGTASDRDSELAALYFLTQHGEGGVG